MTHKKFSASWKSSTQPRKQRKYRFNAPLHHKQKLLHAHLSPVLRKKYVMRNIQIRKNDKVKILRGQFKGKEGKVEQVFLKKGHIHVTGAEIIKRDGGKVYTHIDPSNVIILELELSDKIRKQKLESKTTQPKTSGKAPAEKKEKQK
ncbi:50S ribosomal protein L24 [Candidatus Woesearchaeota archaeon]|nr:50S ribosomal protein L24 [Candidatus Woesearchaeota archaeon]